ncbi:hypothetical protein ALC62_06824 [Cyphomyrmex costatus]|uniref:Uncharacterized protein n=1 Tax=Cyphomyrmex costatus TaxID=456900 RepID=A0A195CQQ8_9HYME|nr:hypothetical protein ALC62_06824 [Cyphomyrmex costatus]
MVWHRRRWRFIPLIISRGFTRSILQLNFRLVGNFYVILKSNDTVSSFPVPSVRPCTAKSSAVLSRIYYYLMKVYLNCSEECKTSKSKEIPREGLVSRSKEYRENPATTARPIRKRIEVEEEEKEEEAAAVDDSELCRVTALPRSRGQ